MNKRISYIARYWLAVIIYVGLIFTASSISNISLASKKLIHIDKLLHIVEYGILGGLLGYALRHTTALKKSFIFIIIMLAGGLIGVLDESYQATVPGRQQSLLDFLFDVIGLAAGCLIYLRYQRKVQDVRNSSV